MKTKYDLFYALCKVSDPTLARAAQLAGISYPSAVKMLKLLEKEFLLKKGLPTTKKAILAKQIIEWCYYYELNYDFFFSEKLATFLALSLSNGGITSHDEKNFNRNTFFSYTRKLKEKHLLLIVDKKPINAIMYSNHILEKVLKYYGHAFLVKEKVPSVHVYEKIARLLKNDTTQEIEFLHSSLFMEGTTLTLSDTKNLFIKKTAPNKPLVDIKNMENYKLATEYVRSTFTEDLTKEAIVKLQAISMADAGTVLGIRTKDVHIRGNARFNICSPNKVHVELRKFITYFNRKIKQKLSVKESIATSAFIHNQFQYIHPFYDGNSRTTRLLWQYFLLCKKFPLITIYAAQKEKYMSLTKLYKKRDDNKLAEFFAFIILDNLQNKARD